MGASLPARLLVGPAAALPHPALAIPERRRQARGQGGKPRSTSRYALRATRALTPRCAGASTMKRAGAACVPVSGTILKPAVRRATIFGRARAPKEGVPAHPLMRSAALGFMQSREVVRDPSTHPLGSRSFVRLCRSIRPSAAGQVGARSRVRTCSDSPTGLSDAFEKPALPRALAPRRRRLQNKEAVLGRLCFARQPDPMPTAEGSENQEGGSPPTMVFETEAASSSSIYRCTQRYGRVAALGRAAQQTDGGGLLH